MPDPDLTATWYVIYRDADGFVLTGGQIPRYALDDFPSAGIPAGHSIIEVDHEPDMAAGEWVVSGDLVPGDPFTPTVSTSTIAADGVEECTISGLPNPSLVSVRHISPQITDPSPDTEVTDGEIVLTAILPGTITVRIVSPGNAHWTGSIDAV